MSEICSVYLVRVLTLVIVACGMWHAACGMPLVMLHLLHAADCRLYDDRPRSTGCAALVDNVWGAALISQRALIE